MVRPLLVLIFLCAIPDAVVVPVLRDLIVDRYGASPLEAQSFLALNLLGLLAAAPVAAHLRRRWSPARVLVVGALADAALLALLAAPIGLGWTLAVRAAEGLPDALVFGELFALIGAVERSTDRVRRYGWASTTLMLAIGIGIGAGGLAARHAGSLGVYTLGALANLAIAVLVSRWSLPARDVVGADASGEPSTDADAAHNPAEASSTSRRMWPPLVMAFGDRATGGAITSALPLFLDRLFGASATERGWMVGLPMVLMALGAGPAARVAAAVGVRRTRAIAATIYAASLMALSLCAPDRARLMPLLILLGVSGSALLPTSLAITARSRRGCEALAAFAAAGGAGQALGLLVPLMLFAGLTVGVDDVRELLLSFALIHFATTVITIAPIFRRQQRVGLS